MQNILHASKLLEGRITFNELCAMGTAAFDKLVENEFANIDQSYKDFKERNIVNAYTKNETYSKQDAKALEDITKQVSSQ
jgi:hypothetical protein